jgi:indole-3-glycerol phosphate synthase
MRLALRRDSVAVIAELKRRSPSKGTLNNALNAGQSVLFERGGAAAVSVLTEPEFFGGSLDDLVAVRSAVRLPLLKKDFHIDPSQLIEARLADAAAVLLIARALSPDELPRMVSAAKHLDLEPFVEVRTDEELERALASGAEIIGVNSRDLETLEVDEDIPARLIPRIPPHLIAVWESGIDSPAHVRRAAESGADAVLVGSVLSRSDNPERLVREMSTVRRQPRAGRD